jgi:hypothetical protein
MALAKSVNAIQRYLVTETRLKIAIFHNEALIVEGSGPSGAERIVVHPCNVIFRIGTNYYGLRVSHPGTGRARRTSPEPASSGAGSAGVRHAHHLP